MSDFEQLKKMMTHFRISELQQLLTYAGRSKNGKKAELFDRATSLLSDCPAPMKIKIKDLYKKVINSSSGYQQVRNRQIAGGGGGAVDDFGHHLGINVGGPGSANGITATTNNNGNVNNGGPNDNPYGPPYGLGHDNFYAHHQQQHQHMQQQHMQQAARAAHQFHGSTAHRYQQQAAQATSTTSYNHAQYLRSVLQHHSLPRGPSFGPGSAPGTNTGIRSALIGHKPPAAAAAPAGQIGVGAAGSLPVQPDVRFRALPFYERVCELVKPTTLVPITVEKNVPQENFFIFNLTPQMVEDITASKFLCPATMKTEYSTQIQLRFCGYDLTNEQEDNFPSNITVKVNGIATPLPLPLPPKAPSLEPKRPGRPLNITPLCKLSSMTENQISVTWTNSLCSTYIAHVMALFLVKKISTKTMLQRLKTKGIRDSDVTKALIKEKLKCGTDDLEIATTSLRISLICPLSKCPMVYACRASTCKHFQCFDADTFLLMNEKNPKWMCPVCHQPALYSNLMIDGLFMEILGSSPASMEIEFFQDASWSAVGGDHSGGGSTGSGAGHGKSHPTQRQTYSGHSVKAGTGKLARFESNSTSEAASSSAAAQDASVLMMSVNLSSDTKSSSTSDDDDVRSIEQRDADEDDEFGIGIVNRSINRRAIRNNTYLCSSPSVTSSAPSDDGDDTVSARFIPPSQMQFAAQATNSPTFPGVPRIPPLPAPGSSKDVDADDDIEFIDLCSSPESSPIHNIIESDDSPSHDTPTIVVSNQQTFTTEPLASLENKNVPLALTNTITAADKTGNGSNDADPYHVTDEAAADMVAATAVPLFYDFADISMDDEDDTLGQDPEMDFVVLPSHDDFGDEGSTADQRGGPAIGPTPIANWDGSPAVGRAECYTNRAHGSNVSSGEETKVAIGTTEGTVSSLKRKDENEGYHRSLSLNLPPPPTLPPNKRVRSEVNGLTDRSPDRVGLFGKGGEADATACGDNFLEAVFDEAFFEVGGDALPTLGTSFPADTGPVGEEDVFVGHPTLDPLNMSPHLNALTFYLFQPPYLAISSPFTTFSPLKKNATPQALLSPRPDSFGKPVSDDTSSLVGPANGLSQEESPDTLLAPGAFNPPPIDDHVSLDPRDSSQNGTASAAIIENNVSSPSPFLLPLIDCTLANSLADYMGIFMRSKIISQQETMVLSPAPVPQPSLTEANTVITSHHQPHIENRNPLPSKDRVTVVNIFQDGLLSGVSNDYDLTEGRSPVKKSDPIGISTTQTPPRGTAVSPPKPPKTLGRPPSTEEIIEAADREIARNIFTLMQNDSVAALNLRGRDSVAASVVKCPTPPFSNTPPPIGSKVDAKCAQLLLRMTQNTPPISPASVPGDRDRTTSSIPCTHSQPRGPISSFHHETSHNTTLSELLQHSLPVTKAGFNKITLPENTTNSSQYTHHLVYRPHPCSAIPSTIHHTCTYIRDHPSQSTQGPPSAQQPPPLKLITASGAVQQSPASSIFSSTKVAHLPTQKSCGSSQKASTTTDQPKQMTTQNKIGVDKDLAPVITTQGSLGNVPKVFYLNKNSSADASGRRHSTSNPTDIKGPKLPSIGSISVVRPKSFHKGNNYAPYFYVHNDIDTKGSDKVQFGNTNNNHPYVQRTPFSIMQRLPTNDNTGWPYGKQHEVASFGDHYAHASFHEDYGTPDSSYFGRGRTATQSRPFLLPNPSTRAPLLPFPPGHQFYRGRAGYNINAAHHQRQHQQHHQNQAYNQVGADGGPSFYEMSRFGPPLGSLLLSHQQDRPTYPLRRPNRYTQSHHGNRSTVHRGSTSRPIIANVVLTEQCSTVPDAKGDEIEGEGGEGASKIRAVVDNVFECLTARRISTKASSDH